MSQDPKNERVELPGNDDEELREYGRQLALDGLLELALGNRVGRANLPAPARPSPSTIGKWLQVAAVGVAFLVFGMGDTLIRWVAGPGKPPPAHKKDVAQIPV